VNVARAAAGVLVVAGGICLCVACWRRRSVLGGLLGAASISIVSFRLGVGGGRHVTSYSLAVGALALVIGTALSGIGQVLERLLDEGAEAEDRSWPTGRRRTR
jgi:hypothetical protein